MHTTCIAPAAPAHLQVVQRVERQQRPLVQVLVVVNAAASLGDARLRKRAGCGLAGRGLAGRGLAGRGTAGAAQLTQQLTSFTVTDHIAHT